MWGKQKGNIINLAQIITISLIQQRFPDPTLVAEAAKDYLKELDDVLLIFFIVKHSELALIICRLADNEEDVFVYS